MSNAQAKTEAIQAMLEITQRYDEAIQLLTAAIVRLNSGMDAGPLPDDEPLADVELDELLTAIKKYVTTGPVAEPASRGSGHWQGN